MARKTTFKILDKNLGKELGKALLTDKDIRRLSRKIGNLNFRKFKVKI